MLKLWGNDRAVHCDGCSRRHFLQVGSLAVGGLSLTDLLRSDAAAAAGGREKSVILYWLDGGPTHMETYDPKPDAPAEYRGPLGAIATNVPGIQLSELLAEHSQVMDKVSLLRSVHHNNGDHFAAAHWMLTGYHGSNAANRDPQYPGVGAVLAKTRGAIRGDLPAYVAVPRSMTVGISPGYLSATHLGPQYNPFETGSDPNRDRFQVRNLGLPGGMTLDRIEDRRTLLTEFDTLRRDVDNSGLIDGVDQFNRNALQMVTGESAREAFDISREDDAVRERYGRNTYGQSALLARRLVEAGVRCVTIHNGGWDHHSNIGPGMKGRLPSMDRSIGVLIADLAERGLLASTVVCVMGEFGRTPRVNASAGRDHWGNVMSVLLGGGGLQGGQVVGASNSKGEHPAERPLTPADVLATIYHTLQVDLKASFHNHAGRPIPINNCGEPITELI